MSRQAIERAVEALERIASPHIADKAIYPEGHIYNAQCDACHRDKIALDALATLRKELDQRAAHTILTEEEIKLVAEHRVAKLRSWDAPGFEACVRGAADELRSAVAGRDKELDQPEEKGGDANTGHNSVSSRPDKTPPAADAEAARAQVLEAGGFYWTRDGRRIGPLREQKDSSYWPWHIAGEGSFDRLGRFNGEFPHPKDLTSESTHVLVPVEPTEAMIDIGDKTFWEFKFSSGGGPRKALCDAYKAMLAASRDTDGGRG